MISLHHTYWCSIWKLRCPVNQSWRDFYISHLLVFYLELRCLVYQSLKKDFSISHLLMLYPEVEMPCKPITEERFLYITLTDSLSGSSDALYTNHWGNISLYHTYRCSIWKLRWPVNQSLRKGFYISQLLMLYLEAKMPCKPIIEERLLYITVPDTLSGSWDAL